MTALTIGKVAKRAGHVWWGRFKALAIKADGPQLTVVRDVERNPRLADRGDRAEPWRGSSMHGHGPRRKPAWWSDPPVERPRRWAMRVAYSFHPRFIIIAPETDLITP